MNENVSQNSITIIASIFQQTKTNKMSNKRRLSSIICLIIKKNK